MSEFRLGQNLSQTQTLAPQMRKSLEILQANTQELNQLLSQAIELNPVLEDASQLESLDADGPNGEELDSLDYLNETEDDWRDRAIMEGKAGPWTTEDEERRQHLFDSIVARETLQSHLQRQLDQSLVSDDVRSAASILLGGLDERGFFDSPPAELAARFHIRAAPFKAALMLIQSFDPAGIGAETITHSLLLQLERKGMAESIEHRIVREHLEDLARKRYPQIAKALGTTIERINAAAEEIGRLTPNPGAEFDPMENPFVEPDVVIERDGSGRFHARLTGDSLPQLRLNDHYKDMLGDGRIDPKARQYLREQIREGRSLIHAIGLRQETILAIAHKIIEHQSEFLAKGPRFLRPLTMNELASELDMHATTISRAVAGKYVLTPRGLMEMRAFFATGYHTTSGEDVSNTAVRDALQKLVADEDHAKPLSDLALAKALADQGLKVARRTIAKYRDQLNILPSHLRKSF